MTRIAVCLYGRFGNRFDKSAGEKGIKYLLEKVVSGVKVDVFVYSHDVAHSSEIAKALGSSLTDSRFIEPKDYLRDFIEMGGDPELFQLDDPSRGVAGTLSFIAQRDGAIQLMSDWSARNQLKYDSVLVSRIDLGQIDQHNRRYPQRVSEAPSLVNLAGSKFVFHAAWNQLNEGLPDQWFVLSQTDAITLGGGLSRFSGYLRPGSDYLSWCSQGISMSSRHNQFSNEPQNATPASDLSRRHASKALDNHLLHKFDFIRTGLFEKLRPAFDSHGIPQLTYSHSSYLDGYKLTRSQQERHLGTFGVEYLALDSSHSAAGLPRNVKVLPYQDTLSYTDRLRSVVEQVDEEYLFFVHEDMPLVSTPVIESFFEAKRILESKPTNAVVRLIRVGRGLPLNLHKPSRLPFFIRVGPLSPWQFSIQPSLWKKSALLELLNECPGLNVWEFEVRGQRAFRKMRLRGFQPLSSGPRRGRHHFASSVYPYIATAIVKGKWNTTEYPELKPLLATVDLSSFAPRDSLS